MIIYRMITRLAKWGLLGLISVGSTALIWTNLGMEKIYNNFDGIYYLVVGKTWYDPEQIGKNFEITLPAEYYAAHFPMYPGLINLFSQTGLNHLQSMVVINLLASWGGAVAIYEIFKKNGWGKPDWAAIAWLFWWPRMWGVRSVGSPETLFVLAITLSLYWFSLKKYWLAGLAGALAVATKSPGILLFAAYAAWLGENTIRTKKIEWKTWPVLLIPLTLLGVFYFFFLRTGDFLAYFHSGDNIHLQTWPFGVFNSEQPWVGTWWLDDIIWVYLVGAAGVVRAFAKSRVWGWFGAVFGLTLLFVAHRDVTRYSLPLVPVVLAGLSDIWDKKEVRWAITLAIIPLFFYTLNFLAHNLATNSTLAPYL